MPTYDFDLFVIGAGSGGVRASRIAAATGARVAVAESGPLGGTCVNVGCVPKKLLVYASQYGEGFSDAEGFGWSTPQRNFSWPTLISNKNREIERLNGIYQRLLDNAGVEIFLGRARLSDAHTVEVAGKCFTAERILVATGGRPWMPDIPGIELCISSDEAFYLEDLPQRVVIVGGGYIAVEFAGIFHGLGAEVTQLYRGPLFLREFDDDIRTTLADEIKKRGVDLRFGSNATAVAQKGERLEVTLTSGETIEADQVLMATGRVPNTADLGLEQAGVTLGKGGKVVVNELSQTSVEHIYAIGDCTDRFLLTPVALAEAMAFVNTVYRGQPTPVSYNNVATAVFSQPNVGTVGPTEAEARELYGELDIYHSSFRPMKHTMSGRNEKTMMKLIVESSTQLVRAVHMVGPDAGEIIQGIAVAMNCGVTKQQLDSTIGIHPTAAEELVTMRVKRE